MRREEKPTRYHCMLYCAYDTLNMFRALLCSSSGALDYICVITAYGVQCLVAGCRGSGAGQQGVRLGRGMLHVYCTYDTLNIFRAFICPSSGALDYMYDIADYGVQCLVTGCRGQVQGSRVCV